MKKKIIILSAVILTLFVTACGKEANPFKESYESLNGVTNASGKEHRTVHIIEANPFVTVSANDIVKKIENEETFYVYFGSKLCPWCRSVIEKFIEVANDYKIKQVYYVDIWDDNGNEILRDKYTLEDGNKTLTISGTEDYYKLLEYLEDVLPEYTITSDGKEVGMEEKRIYAPTFIYVEKGKAIKMTTGISDLQKDARGELTQEILNDEQEQFRDFFATSCDKSC